MQRIMIFQQLQRPKASRLASSAWVPALAPDHARQRAAMDVPRASQVVVARRRFSKARCGLERTCGEKEPLRPLFYAGMSSAASACNGYGGVLRVIRLPSPG